MSVYEYIKSYCFFLNNCCFIFLTTKIGDPDVIFIICLSKPPYCNGFSAWQCVQRGGLLPSGSDFIIVST